jgi:exopolysaccharide biosynthesis polyprenyl glycosylphosphotransferase
MISETERDLRLSYVISDTLALALSLPLAALVSHRAGVLRELLGHNVWVSAVKLILVGFLWYLSLHETGAFEFKYSKWESGVQVVKAVLLFWVILTAVFFLSFTIFSRASSLLLIPILVSVTLLFRNLVSPPLFRLAHPMPSRVLLLGRGSVAERLEAYLQDRIGILVQCANFCPEVPLECLEDLLDQVQPDEVIVACRGYSFDSLVVILNKCQKRDIRWGFVPDPDLMLFSGTAVHVIAGVPLVAFHGSQISGFNFLSKRALDLGISAVLALAISPVLLLIALAIRLSSPGPAIYRQERVGFRGRRFQMFKFRSMYVNQDDDVHRRFVKDWISKGKDASNTNGVFKIDEDKRVTPVGRFLRKYSLDELPQLFNVLKGDMSLVGPRPALPYELESYKDWHLERLDAPPGITGLWQVNGRNAVPFDRMVELDIEYLRSWTLRKDLAILAKTVPVALFASGH